MRHPRNVRAFVLLEVVLAAAIGGLVLLVLMNGFSLVTRSYRRIVAASDARVRSFAALLGEDLRSVYKEDSGQGAGREEGQRDVFAFTAEPAEVCFVRTRRLGRAGDADVTDGLIRVCYGGPSSPARDGELVRRVYYRTAGEDPPDEERVALTGWTAVRWNYYDGVQWKTVWASSGQVPRRVRVVISSDRGKGVLEDYELVFDVPVA
jgi:hypothetical protein